MLGEPLSGEALAVAARRAGVRDPRVLGALAAVDRTGFVPSQHAALADRDVPVPIPHDQVTTQPSLSARMIEGLDLVGTERVLEVGTGYGFQTAVLAALSREVYSVERWPDLADAAREHLAARGVGNVRVFVGDGSQGLPDGAPYQAILVSAASPQVPPPLVAQLAPDGRLVQPIGLGGHERVTLFRGAGRGRLEAVRVLTGAHFVPLRGRHGLTAWR
jgi:protein-L-isoaspartate(D-aspartate) O-methyltransferase